MTIMTTKTLRTHRYVEENIWTYLELKIPVFGVFGMLISQSHSFTHSVCLSNNFPQTCADIYPIIKIEPRCLGVHIDPLLHKDKEVNDNTSPSQIE